MLIVYKYLAKKKDQIMLKKFIYYIKKSYLTIYTKSSLIAN